MAQGIVFEPMTPTRKVQDAPPASENGERPRLQGPRPEEWKTNMARGQSEGHVVRRYLTALMEAQPGGRSFKDNPDWLEKRIAQLDEQVKSATDAVKRLIMENERLHLLERLDIVLSDPVNPAVYEDSFIEIGLAYTQRKGIRYEAWRNAGVPARVLKAAGITRTSHLGD